VLTALVLVVAILALGAHLTDGVRLREEELILRKLPEEEAVAYYEVLKQRARRIRLLRAVTLASLALVLLAMRRRLFRGAPTPGRPAAPPPPTNTEAARAAATEALRDYAFRVGLSPARFEAGAITGDDKYPWIFEYRAQPPSRRVVRIYVARDGTVELHPLIE
jgi:hypothetical protein